MKQALKIIVTILIGIVLVIGASVVIAYVFKDKVPIGVEIPEAEKYTDINRPDYVVSSGGIFNAENERVIYESTNSELEYYGQELRYISGRTEPLTNPKDPLPRDIPSDYILRGNTSASNNSGDDLNDD